MTAVCHLIPVLPTLLTLALSSRVADGAPLSELSWPSSLAVVAVSFSGLFTFVFLMLACLCCKKGDIGFKEFENTEGEEYQADLSTLASPSSQNGPEVYILPLTEVSLPVSKQPGRSIISAWTFNDLFLHLGFASCTTQVVVKELKSSASVQDQMQFLEEVQPYRTLQHPALLQCLAQCSEVTPYLLVMEFCPLGDLKSYLCSCRVADSETPDPLILQRMACDIASGLLQLHKYNFIHSDLALRNCLLTSEMSVRIGDYGLSHSRYKDDYYVTQDQIWVPLRWIAPELIDEVHGNLLVVDQTKSSNIWSLGVTVWELFELGNQPYRHYSDRQVLTYAVKEQQLKLPKPLLQFPLAERWYEVMQFCWLQPELRPSSEEVHLLLTYLYFEQRWNLASSASSSFPLLDHFSDSFHSDTGDDLLTVMETSHGLNFEYKWEQPRAEQPYCSSSTSGTLGQGNPYYQDIYYSSKGSTSGGCKTDSLTSGISPSYYEPEHPGVVPVLSAHSPSVSSEYYIRIEEPVECNINLDDSMVDYSPGLEASSSRLSTESRTDSSISLAELGDYSEDDDDDITDITSGIFADFNLDYAELEEEELSPLKHPEGTPDSVDTLNLSSSMASPCDQAFSPDPFNTPVLPKSLDSGYDTENNESPEFLFKELGDPRGGERSPRLGGEPELVLHVGLGQGVCTSTSTSELKSLTDKNPYRDSAYFSDYDAENERSPQEEGSKFFAGLSNHDYHTEKLSSIRVDDLVKRQFNKEHLTNLRHIKNCALVNLSEADPSSHHPLHTPGLSMLSPFPPQMGGCLTKESAPADDDLGLESEHSGEEPSSELCSSIGSEAPSTVQEAPGNHEEGNRRAEDCSPVQSLHSDSTITEYRDEAPKENENGDGSTESTEEELPEFIHIKEEEEDRREGVRLNEEDFEDIDAGECDSQDSLCEESNGPRRPVLFLVIVGAVWRKRESSAGGGGG
uniref:Apoptosis associated tyrosine kinase n=1 Tax=Sander lucioperca TaxID=283035 RepID=A0A8C9YSF2_SANLU